MERTSDNNNQISNKHKVENTTPNPEHCRLSLHILLFRLKLWKKKANTCKNTSNPKLNLLPPIDEALTVNILRAHYQIAIWKSCMDEIPPNEDSCKAMMKSIFS